MIPRAHAPLRLAASVLLGLCGAASAPSVAHALPTFPPLVPNTASAFSEDTGTERPCITCHNNPDGGLGCVDGSGTEGHIAPCLNPFGMNFRMSDVPGTVDKQWTQALALLDSDGDGFTNGQELQDPDGTWVFGQPRPGNAEMATRPGFAAYHPGLHEEDGDGYCWFGLDMNGDGVCIEDDERDAGRDCDDMNASVHSGATEICDDDLDNDCDGYVSLDDPDCDDVADNDGDGYCETGQDMNGDGDCLDTGETGGEVDCNDEAPSVYPGAPENCADGLDNDCDDLTDLDDTENCSGNADEDGDGYCPVGEDLNDDGDCLDAGEPAGPSDCNDTDPDVGPQATEICTDRIDNDCDGDTDFADAECAHIVDGDGDGFCPQGRDLNRDGDCADTGEDTGESDCDDGSINRNPDNDELCTDGVDNDCDDQVDVDDADCADFLDMDGDGFCPAGEDANGDGDCVDDREVSTLADCDDADPTIKPGPATLEACSDPMDEACAACRDGLDNECDGFTDHGDSGCALFADRDGDGFCPVGRDGNADGDCLDPDEDQGPGDCNDDNAAVSPGRQENCFDGFDNNCDGLADVCAPNDPGCDAAEADPTCTGTEDADGDGYCRVGRDDNGDGDCLDSGENAALSDCDDANPMVHPGVTEDALERCVDNVDNDCDGAVDRMDRQRIGADGTVVAIDCAAFLDQDGDSFCPHGQDLNFNGDCLGRGEQTAASDCNDEAPTAFPGRREECDDGLDNDCDGLVDAWDTQSCTCETDTQCEVAEDATCTVGACDSDRCVERDDPTCTPDGGAADASSPDGGTLADGGMVMPPEPPGCGCRAPASRGASGGTLWLAGLAMGAWLWRRRRRQ